MFTTYAQFSAAREAYVTTGTDADHEAYETARANYNSAERLIAEGRASAESTMARERIAARGY